MSALVPQWPDDGESAHEAWHPDGILGGVAERRPVIGGLRFLTGDQVPMDSNANPDGASDMTSSHNSHDPNIIGKVWNLPNSLIGLGVGGLGYLAGLPLHWLGLQDQPGVMTGNNAVHYRQSIDGAGRSDHVGKCSGVSWPADGLA